MTILTVADPRFWSDRYRNALAPAELRRRATVRGRAVAGLNDLEIEVACRQLELSLERAFLMTDQIAAIMTSLLERALAHALLVYTDPMSVIGAGYSGDIIHTPQAPTVITGLAGTGKSEICKAMARVLNGRRRVYLDPEHPRIELIDFVALVVGTQNSPKGVFMDLATDESLKRAVGETPESRARWTEPELVRECARKMRVAGTCLLGVDEMQFFTQSSSANKLVSRLLLGLCDIRVPWFFNSNYSLLWRLLDQPAEVRQRLLGRPMVLVPDAPSSADWAALLDEYNTICDTVLEFDLRQYSVELWSLTAGIKREVLRLIVNAYRVARLLSRSRIRWSDICAAYLSDCYAASKADVESLIAHAGQGKRIRRDLWCPFSTSALGDYFQAYSQGLKHARELALAKAVIDASRNAAEQKAVAILNQRSRALDGVDQETAAKKAPRQRRTFDSAQEAGRRLRETVQEEGSRSVRRRNPHA